MMLDRRASPQSIMDFPDLDEQGTGYLSSSSKTHQSQHAGQKDTKQQEATAAGTSGPSKRLSESSRKQKASTKRSGSRGSSTGKSSIRQRSHQGRCSAPAGSMSPPLLNRGRSDARAYAAESFAVGSIRPPLLNRAKSEGKAVASHMSLPLLNRAKSDGKSKSPKRSSIERPRRKISVPRLDLQDLSDESESDANRKPDYRWDNPRHPRSLDVASEHRRSRSGRATSSKGSLGVASEHASRKSQQRSGLSPKRVSSSKGRTSRQDNARRHKRSSDRKASLSPKRNSGPAASDPRPRLNRSKSCNYKAKRSEPNALLQDDRHSKPQLCRMPSRSKSSELLGGKYFDAGEQQRRSLAVLDIYHGRRMGDDSSFESDEIHFPRSRSSMTDGSLQSQGANSRGSLAGGPMGDTLQRTQSYDAVARRGRRPTGTPRNHQWVSRRHTIDDSSSSSSNRGRRSRLERSLSQRDSLRARARSNSCQRKLQVNDGVEGGGRRSRLERSHSQRSQRMLQINDGAEDEGRRSRLQHSLSQRDGLRAPAWSRSSQRMLQINDGVEDGRRGSRRTASRGHREFQGFEGRDSNPTISEKILRGWWATMMTPQANSGTDSRGETQRTTDEGPATSDLKGWWTSMMHCPPSAAGNAAETVIPGGGTESRRSRAAAIAEVVGTNSNGARRFSYNFKKDGENQPATSTGHSPSRGQRKRANSEGPESKKDPLSTGIDAGRDRHVDLDESDPDCLPRRPTIFPTFSSMVTAKSPACA